MQYKISKGKHYTDGFHFGLHFGMNAISHRVKFHSSCYYDLKSADQSDFNKLYGFSEGLHHKNSARFAWRCNTSEKCIELHSYVYRDGHRVNEWDTNTHLINVGFDRSVYTMIVTKETHYVFHVSSEGKTVIKVVARGRNPLGLGYKLWPYFGGTSVAPHDMYIEIE